MRLQTTEGCAVAGDRITTVALNSLTLRVNAASWKNHTDAGQRSGSPANNWDNKHRLIAIISYGIAGIKDRLW